MHLDIVGEVHYLAHLDTRLGLQLIPGDGGTLTDLGDAGLDIEHLQCLLELGCRLPEGGRAVSLGSLALLQKLCRGEHIGARRGGRLLDGAITLLFNGAITLLLNGSPLRPLWGALSLTGHSHIVRGMDTVALLAYLALGGGKLRLMGLIGQSL